jgi:hypothetical protein
MRVVNELYSSAAAQISFPQGTHFTESGSVIVKSKDDDICSVEKQVKLSVRNLYTIGRYAARYPSGIEPETIQWTFQDYTCGT